MASIQCFCNWKSGLDCKIEISMTSTSGFCTFHEQINQLIQRYSNDIGNSAATAFVALGLLLAKRRTGDLDAANSVDQIIAKEPTLKQFIEEYEATYWEMAAEVNTIE